MDTLAAPAGVATLVARNAAPALGVLFFGWSAANLLVLYWIDTVLAFAVVVVLVARHVTGLGRPGRRGRTMQAPMDWLRAAPGALLGAVLIGAPLAVPLTSNSSRVVLCAD